MEFEGTPIIKGEAKGSAIVTSQPINFTASMTKITNMLPTKSAEIRDAHHELFKQNLAGKIVIFPSCIGSTHTGLVLLDLVAFEKGPAGLIVEKADSLLISGIVLADVWYDKKIPIIECDSEDLFNNTNTGKEITIKIGGQIVLDDD